jgi:hypothetical protein
VTTTQGRLSHEFHRLDDELSAGVPLPSVDAVIGRAATLNRASMAAAIAVLAVGALGGVTAIAHAGVHPTLAAAADVIPPAATTTAAPTTTTTPPPPVVAPPVTTVAPVPVRPRTRVVVPTRRKTVAPVPTTVAKPPPVVETTTVAPTNSEGTPDSPTTKPTKKGNGRSTPSPAAAAGGITPVDDTSAGTLSGLPATS